MEANQKHCRDFAIKEQQRICAVYVDNAKGRMNIHV